MLRVIGLRSSPRRPALSACWWRCVIRASCLRSAHRPRASCRWSCACGSYGAGSRLDSRLARRASAGTRSRRAPARAPDATAIRREPVGRGTVVGAERIERLRRARPALLGERIVLPDQARQFGQRIAGRIASPCGAIRIGRELRSLVVCSSAILILSPILCACSVIPELTVAPETASNGTERDYRISSGAPTPSSAKPGSKDGDDALHQCEARHGQSWIILDNEP